MDPDLLLRLLTRQYEPRLKRSQPGLQCLPRVIGRKQKYTVAKALYHHLSTGKSILFRQPNGLTAS